MSRVPIPQVENHPSLDQRIVNPRNGRLECVAVNLEAVYPDPCDPTVEYCFEELRAARQGWLQRKWQRSSSLRHSSPQKQREPLEDSPLKALNIRPQPGQTRSHAPQTVPLNDDNDENADPNVDHANIKYKSVQKTRKKDEDDNKTRKIRVRELKSETQTSKSRAKRELHRD